MARRRDRREGARLGQGAERRVAPRELAKAPAFQALDERLLKILDSKERIPFVSKTRRAATTTSGATRRTSAACGGARRSTSTARPTPTWETVLDLDALGRGREGELGLARRRLPASRRYERCLIALSRGGADADVVREFDPKTKAFVKDGFTLPEAKSDVAWKDRDTLYVGTDFGPGSLTESGYPRIVKEWKRGTPLADASTRVRRAEDRRGGRRRMQRPTPGLRARLRARAPSTFCTSRDVFLRRDGKLDQDRQAATTPSASVHREWLLVTLRTRLDSRRQDLPRRLAARRADFDAFLAGERDVRRAVRADRADRRSPAYSPTRNHVILNELDNVRNRVYVLTRKDGRLDARRAARAAGVRQRRRHRRRRRRVGRLLPDGRRTT